MQLGGPSLAGPEGFPLQNVLTFLRCVTTFELMGPPEAEVLYQPRSEIWNRLGKIKNFIYVDSGQRKIPTVPVFAYLGLRCKEHVSSLKRLTNCKITPSVTFPSAFYSWDQLRIRVSLRQ